MLTPQQITECADIYKRLKEIDRSMDSVADSYRFGLWSHNRAGGVTSTIDLTIQQDAEFTATMRTMILNHIMKKRAVLERRLRQIGAPVPELLEE